MCQAGHMHMGIDGVPGRELRSHLERAQGLESDENADLCWVTYQLCDFGQVP